MKVYEIADNLMAVENLLVENSDPETMEILEENRKILESALEDKMEDVMEYIAELSAKVEYLRGEEIRLANKRRVVSNRVDSVKKLVRQIMNNRGLKKAEWGTWTVRLVKSPAHMVVADEAVMFLPDEYVRKEVNKTALKSDMVDGKFTIEVDGVPMELAHMEDGGESLRIG